MFRRILAWIALVVVFFAPCNLGAEQWKPDWWVEDCTLTPTTQQKRLVWLRERTDGFATFMVVYGYQGCAYQVTCRQHDGEIVKVERAWLKFATNGITMGTSDPYMCNGVYSLSVESPSMTVPFIPSLYLQNVLTLADGKSIVTAFESGALPPFKVMDNPGYFFEACLDKSWQVTLAGWKAHVKTAFWGENISDALSSTALSQSLSTRPPEAAHLSTHADLHVCNMALPTLTGGAKWEPILLRGSNAFHAGDVYSFYGRTQLLAAKQATTSDNSNDHGFSPTVSFSFVMRVAGVFASRDQKVVLLTSMGNDSTMERAVASTHQRNTSEGDPQIASFSSHGAWSKPSPLLPPAFQDDRNARFRASIRNLPLVNKDQRAPTLWCYVCDADTGALLALKGYLVDAFGTLSPSTSISFDGGHVGMLMSRNFFRNQDCLQMSSFAGQRRASGYFMLKPTDPSGFERMDLGLYQLKLTPLLEPFTIQSLTQEGYAVDWTNAKPPYTAKPINLKAIMDMVRGEGKDHRSKHLAQLLNNSFGSWSTQRGVNPFYVMLHDGSRYFSCQTWGSMAIPMWSRMTSLDLASNTVTEISLSAVMRRGLGNPLSVTRLFQLEMPSYDVLQAPPPKTTKPPVNPAPPPPKVEIPGKY